MSGCFYAIGGANYEKNESLIIDLDIIKSTGKTYPVCLYIGAANPDINKCFKFKEYYEKLGFVVDILPFDLSGIDVEEAFNKADIIYLGGGITARLKEYYLKFNLLNPTINAYKNGKIIVGVSAGAILLFECGYGDKEAYTYNLETVNHNLTSGLGIFKGIFCPHYQNSGLLSFHDEVKKHQCDAFALENGAALKINEDGYYVVKDKGANAFKFDSFDNHKLVYLKKDIFYRENLFK